MSEVKCCLLVVWQSERSAITELLHKAGLRVHHASKGAEIVQWLEDNRDEPCDLIVSDAKLPDMTVWEMLAEIGEIMNVSDIPTVVFTQRSIVVPFNNVTPLVSPMTERQLRHVLDYVLNANAS
jgi:response regulator RpfG family c-di-GMP phosphodiesterase